MAADSKPAPKVQALLDAGVGKGIFPAAVAWAAVDAQPAFGVAAGDATMETVFDIASLTKPRAVVHLVMVAVAAGTIDLDAPAAPDLGPWSWRALLSHRSGLPAWVDLRAHWLASDRTKAPLPTALAYISSLGGGAYAGAAASYSDLGYIILGHALSRINGCPLSRQVPGYRPVGTETPGPQPAPSGLCPHRGPVPIGEVHDTNCWHLGGVAGHAGLFASADELGRWALNTARAAWDLPPLPGAPSGPDGAIVRDFWNTHRYQDGGSWAMGWDTASPSGSTAGETVTPGAIGHLGFTGTSIWIEPALRSVIVLLTNRTASTVDSQKAMRAFRPRFHDQIRATITT